MDLIAKSSGGPNIVARPQARPAWYPTGTVRPVNAAVYWRYEGDPISAAQLIGIFSPTAEIEFPFNPLVDRNVLLSVVGIAADGTRSVRELADAPTQLVTFQRETTAPTVTEIRQHPPIAAYSQIALAIDNFSALALKRRIRIADDAAMMINVQVQEFIVAGGGDVLPRVVYLDRHETEIALGTRTIWVRIAHASGAQYGAESIAAAFTYADSTGAGGSSEVAEGDPFGQVRFDDNA